MIDNRKRSLVQRNSGAASITSTIESDWENDELFGELVQRELFGELVQRENDDHDDECKIIVDMLPDEFLLRTRPSTMTALMIDQLDRFWSHDLFNTREFHDKKDGVCGFFVGNMLFCLDHDDAVAPIGRQPGSLEIPFASHEEDLDRPYGAVSDAQQAPTFQIRVKVDILKTTNGQSNELSRLTEIVQRIQETLNGDTTFLHINDDAELVLTIHHLPSHLLTESGFGNFAVMLDEFIDQAKNCRRGFKAARRKGFLQRRKAQLGSLLSIRRGRKA